MGYLLKSNFIVLQLLRDEEGWRDKATKLWLRWRVFTYPGLSAETTELKTFPPREKSMATRRLPLIG